jgi:S1-C subfamily serine protease
MGGDTLTITQGVISGFAEQNGLPWIKTDLMTGPGNSGAMVINDSGELVGVHTQSWSDESMMSSRLAVERPINTIRSMIDPVLVGMADTGQLVAQVTESDPVHPGSQSRVEATRQQAVAAAVQVFALDESGELYGVCSGVMVSEHGHLLMAAHCLEETQFLEGDRWVVGVGLAPDAYSPADQLYKAEVVRIDAALDVALLKVTGDWYGRSINGPTDFPKVVFSADAGVEQDDAVWIIGFPEMGGDTLTVSRGQVTAVTVEDGLTRIETNLLAGEGSSGAMVLNAGFELVGLHVSHVSGQPGSFISVEVPVSAAAYLWDGLFE